MASPSASEHLMEMAVSDDLIHIQNETLEMEMQRSEASGSTIEVKLVLVGHFSCGKTSLMTRFVTGNFTDHTECTIGVTFFTKLIKVGDKFIKFQIWVRKMVKVLCQVNILSFTSGHRRSRKIQQHDANVLSRRSSCDHRL
jgi:Ras family